MKTIIVLCDRCKDPIEMIADIHYRDKERKHEALSIWTGEVRGRINRHPHPYSGYPTADFDMICFQCYTKEDNARRIKYLKERQSEIVHGNSLKYFEKQMQEGFEALNKLNDELADIEAELETLSKAKV